MAIIKIKEKPWAHLRVSRRKYETTKPWKKANLSRVKFEELILSIPREVLDDMKLWADAEKLAQAMGMSSEESRC